MEKSQLKLHLLFLQTYSVCLKKCTNVKIVLKKSYTEKKLTIHLLVTHCLQIVCLIQQKANLLVTKVRIVWKGLVKIYEDRR